MTAATAPKLYTCARCEKRGPAASMIYSTHTGNRYCANVNKCAKRAKRRTR